MFQLVLSISRVNMHQSTSTSVASTCPCQHQSHQHACVNMLMSTSLGPGTNEKSTSNLANINPCKIKFRLIPCCFRNGRALDPHEHSTYGNEKVRCTVTFTLMVLYERSHKLYTICHTQEDSSDSDGLTDSYATAELTKVIYV